MPAPRAVLAQCFGRIADVSLPASSRLEAALELSRVDLNVKEQRGDVWAEHPERQSWPCPVQEVLGD